LLTWTAIHLIAEWTIRLIMLVYVPQRRSPAAARSWLLLIFIFPYLGLLLYSIFGRAYLPRWRIEIQEDASQKLRTVGREVLSQYTAHPDLPIPYQQAVTLAENLGDFGILGGNQVELLVDYDRNVDRLVTDIDGATHHVHLLYYIFGNDATGERVAAALKRAVDRGVKCRVLMDGLGSKRGLTQTCPTDAGRGDRGL
jgi:cardiolipin synthase